MNLILNADQHCGAPVDRYNPRYRLSYPTASHSVHHRRLPICLVIRFALLQKHSHTARCIGLESHHVGSGEAWGACPPIFKCSRSSVFWLCVAAVLRSQPPAAELSWPCPIDNHRARCSCPGLGNWVTDQSSKSRYDTIGWRHIFALLPAIIVRTGRTMKVPVTNTSSQT